MAAFRNVMKVVRDDGVIDVVPDTPRVTVRDNPRPFFRFHPLVTQANDEYKKLLAGAKTLAANGIVVRGVPVTEELYDLILFTVHSFVRPMTTELYALKHNDITIADQPKRLLVTVRNGKTGMRIANTLEGAVAPYNRLHQRYPDAKGEDYIFLPHYENRVTAARIFARQFNALLEETQLKMDAVLQTERTIYSLRHTAICMRIISRRAGSTSSTSPRTPVPASIRSNASMPVTCRSRRSWRRTCRALGSDNFGAGKPRTHLELFASIVARRRYSAGVNPTCCLNARWNAASEW